jgi:hypothetical protein
MVYGLWYMVHDIWHMIYATWYMVYDIWYKYGPVYTLMVLKFMMLLYRLTMFRYTSDWNTPCSPFSITAWEWEQRVTCDIGGLIQYHTI